jgi:hypothetical protein
MEQQQSEPRTPRWLGLALAFALLGPYAAVVLLFISQPIALAVAAAWLLLVAAFLVWASLGRVRRGRHTESRDRRAERAERRARRTTRTPVEVNPDLS